MLHCLAPVAVGVFASSVSAPAALACRGLYCTVSGAGANTGACKKARLSLSRTGETTDGAGRDSSGGAGRRMYGHVSAGSGDTAADESGIPATHPGQLRGLE
ncbi:probable two-component response regulator [Pseudomonas aeruginosa NCMG1179]|nr:probable two-component response regulator [Pseudomonas aeruginosa NCMG1179]